MQKLFLVFLLLFAACEENEEEPCLDDFKVDVPAPVPEKEKKTDIPMLKLDSLYRVHDLEVGSKVKNYELFGLAGEQTNLYELAGVEEGESKLVLLLLTAKAMTGG